MTSLPRRIFWLCASSPRLRFDAKERTLNSQSSLHESIMISAGKCSCCHRHPPFGVAPNWGCLHLYFQICGVLQHLPSRPFCNRFCGTSSQWLWPTWVAFYLCRLCVVVAVVSNIVLNMVCFHVLIWLTLAPNVVHLVASSKAFSFGSTSFFCNVNVGLHGVIRTRAFCVGTTILGRTTSQYPTRSEIDPLITYWRK